MFMYEANRISRERANVESELLTILLNVPKGIEKLRQNLELRSLAVKAYLQFIR